MVMNHYGWLDLHFNDLCHAVGREGDERGLIRAHGDKCYSQRGRFEKLGIPFPHLVACYLLTYLRPWSKEVRKTKDGWKDPFDWIEENYKQRFQRFLPDVTEVSQ